ncbi:MAG: hypothetical protein A2413_05535 [Treponema sp. RIFOXYC1_FULL_61_9]|nr:MAG: hypothetical protein A2413_05535 [Treponema sp. RIFOXYC1_FULL_61_9]
MARDVRSRSRFLAGHGGTGVFLYGDGRTGEREEIVAQRIDALQAQVDLAGSPTLHREKPGAVALDEGAGGLPRDERGFLLEVEVEGGRCGGYGAAAGSRNEVGGIRQDAVQAIAVGLEAEGNAPVGGLEAQVPYRGFEGEGALDILETGRGDAVRKFEEEGIVADAAVQGLVLGVSRPPGGNGQPYRAGAHAGHPELALGLP